MHHSQLMEGTAHIVARFFTTMHQIVVAEHKGEGLHDSLMAVGQLATHDLIEVASGNAEIEEGISGHCTVRTEVVAKGELVALRHEAVVAYQDLEGHTVGVLLLQ